VGNIDSVLPVKQIVARLREEYRQALRQLQALAQD
jgi:hypothetical protein